jgi:hypothetical protein
MSPHLLPVASLQPATMPGRGPLCPVLTNRLVGDLPPSLHHPDAALLGDPAVTFTVTIAQADPPP